MAEIFTSEHLHLALAHLPLFGLLIALIFLVAALIMRHRQLLLLSLVVCMALCASVYALLLTGNLAMEGLSSVHEGLLDETSRQILTAHEERAEAWVPAVYARPSPIWRWSRRSQSGSFASAGPVSRWA